MKKILACTIIILLVFDTLGKAQSFAIDTGSFKYLFWVNNKVHNINTGQSVGDFNYHHMHQNILPVYYKSTKKLAFNYIYNIKIFNQTGKLINTFDLPRNNIIPNNDLTTYYYVKNNDIWKVNLNLTTGALYNDSKITELGIFYNIHDFIAYKNNLLIKLNPKTFKLDLNSKSISESNEIDLTSRINDQMELYKYDYSKCSPDHKYFLNIYSKLISSTIYERSSLIDISSLNSYDVNLDNEEIFGVAWLNNQAGFCVTGVSRRKINSIYKYDFERKEKFKILELGNTFEYMKFKEEASLILLGKSINISRGGTKIILPFSKTGFYPHDYEYNIFDSKLKNVSKDLELTKEVTFYSGSKNLTNFLWTTDSHILFSTKENINIQGTYILNVDTHEKVKLMPYILENALILEDANILIILSNGQLYKCNLDGSKFSKVDNFHAITTGLDYFKVKIDK